MNKFEQLIEHIINDEQDKARALFHDIVVEKSRDIYEGLADQELLGQENDKVNKEPVEDLMAEVEADEIGETMAEEMNDMAEEAHDMEDDEADMDVEPAELGGDEPEGEVGEEELEDRVFDLESELDELRAEFDALMAQEEGEPEHADLDSDEEHGEEDMGDMDKMGDMDEMEPEDKPAFGEAKSVKKTATETMREYVEKVSMPNNKNEGGEVGKGHSASVNTKSTVAGKNDMGGTTANIGKGGAEGNPDGNSPKGAAKTKGDLPHANNFENVPGANTKGYSDKKSAKTGEEGQVAKHSPVAK